MITLLATAQDANLGGVKSFGIVLLALLIIAAMLGKKKK